VISMHRYRRDHFAFQFQRKHATGMRTRRDHGSMIRMRIISILLRNGRFLRHFSFPVPQLQRNYDGAFRRFLLGNDRFFPNRSLTDWKTYVPVTVRPGYERVAAICKKIKLIQRIREMRTRMLDTEHHDSLCRSSPSGTGSHDLFCRVLNVTMLNLSVLPTDILNIILPAGSIVSQSFREP